MKIVLYTNIIMDYLTNREPFVVSAETIFSMTLDNKIRTAITANTITDIAYLLRKHCRNAHTVKTSLAKIMGIFEVIAILKENCQNALKLPMDDYEDALLAECAAQWGATLIVSRDLKDFANSPIKTVTPDEFLKQHTLN